MRQSGFFRDQLSKSLIVYKKKVTNTKDDEQKKKKKKDPTAKTADKELYSIVPNDHKNTLSFFKV